MGREMGGEMGAPLEYPLLVEEGEELVGGGGGEGGGEDLPYEAVEGPGVLGVGGRGRRRGGEQEERFRAMWPQCGTKEEE